MENLFVILIFRFCLIILFIQFSVEQKCHWNLIGNCSAQFCVCCCCLLYKEGKGGKCTEFNSKVLKLFYKNGFHFLDNKIHVPKGISKEQFFSFLSLVLLLELYFMYLIPTLVQGRKEKTQFFIVEGKKKRKVPISLQHNKKQKHLLLTHKRQEER